MRRLLLLAACAFALGGCGGLGASSKPTATSLVPGALATYKDKTMNFSFKYPKNWSIPKRGGHEVNNGALQQYIVDISIPKDQAGMSVEADSNIQPLPAFTNGHHGHIAGDPHTYVYYHRHLDQWPAMRIERYTGRQMTEIDTIANTRKASFDVRIITPNPPFSSRSMAGYNTVVKTLRLPFS